MTMNFAITGVGGLVARRHLDAIRATGNKIAAALDPKDSVGIIDSYDLDVPFFIDTERFRHHLESLRHGPEDARLRFLTVCAPNDVHGEHCRLGLRLAADVICEKPISIHPSELDALKEIETQTGRRVWTILQLRAHDTLRALRERLRQSRPARHDIVVTYVTPRGRWYDVSWKGNPTQSGGIAMNIGVHLFDLLIWLFGIPMGFEVHLHQQRRMGGLIELEQARVAWFLSVDASDLPVREPGASTLRSISIDGTEIDFSTGFAELHTRVYEEILAGRGLGIEDARPSIDLAHRIRHASVSGGRAAHPWLR